MQRKLSAWIQLSVAASLAISIIWEVAQRISVDRFRPIEYFSYVTIQVGIASIFILAATSIAALRGRELPTWVPWAKLFAVTLMTLVALVYNLMLRDWPLSPLDAGYPWPVIPGELQHVWAPLLIIFDWILVSGTLQVDWVHIWCIFFYMAPWTIVTIVIGLVENWYPYWFMNPERVGSWWAVSGYLLAMTVALIGMAALYVSVGRLSMRKVKAAAN